MVQGFGEFGAVVCGLKSEVVVSVTDLGFTSGLDDVDLASDAVCRSEVCFADDFEEGVAEVLYKALWVLEAVFGEGVPDA